MKLKEKTISKNEFSSIYPIFFNDLIEYYPILIKKKNSIDYNNSIVDNLETIIKDEILNNENYLKNWSNGFLLNMKKKLNLEDVYPTTAGFVPNLSGMIKLKVFDNIRIELHFYKSLINNYFNIEILKINTKKKIIHKILGEKIIIGIDEIIVSPENEYKTIFEDVLDLFYNEFENSVFVPYYFDLIRIKNFKVVHKLEDNATISDAFFQKYSKFDESITVIGDIYYKLETI